MKRRILCYVLFVGMMLSVTGCKSQDYQKAVDLFESGQYGQAGEVFANLEDYEDSVAMVRECNYRIAIETLEDMDYETAHSLFLELADYSDSSEMIKKCCYHLALEAMEEKSYLQAKEYWKQAEDYQDARRKLDDFPKTVLMEVLQEQGKLVYDSQDSAYRVTLYPESDQAIGIRYNFATMIEDIEQTQELTLVITWGEKEAQMKGSSTGNVLIVNKKTYDIRESAEGILMLDTYQYGEKIVWSEHRSWCINGNYPNSTPIFLVGALARDGGMIIERMITGVQQILLEQNIGVQLDALGFTSVV